MSLEMTMQELNTNVVELRNVMAQFAKQFTLQPHVTAAEAADKLHGIANKVDASLSELGKATPEAFTVAAEQVVETATQTVEIETDVAVEEQPVVTAQDAADATIALAKAKGKPVVIELFAKFGVERAGQLAESQLADYVAAARAALEA